MVITIVLDTNVYGWYQDYIEKKTRTSEAVNAFNLMTSIFENRDKIQVFATETVEKEIKTKNVNIASILFLSFLLTISIVLSQAINSNSYTLQRESINSGGGNFSSANYFLEATAESIGGNISSSNYAACIGLNCCPADIKAQFINSTLDEDTNISTMTFALWHSDLCMGITNATIECSSNCNPCTDACPTVSTTKHTISLTDFEFGTNTIVSVNPNISSIIYCQVTDDTFQLQTCFHTPTNLSVSVEAGGPYTSSSATALIVGNVSFDDGTKVAAANVTVDLYNENDLTIKLATSNMRSSSNGTYFATFSNLDLGIYRVNVSAKYNSLKANATDNFDVINPLGNCNLQTISMSGRALDATTGLAIPSGVASITIKETGDKTDVAISDGVWGADMITCVASGQRYTISIRFVDNQGKVSWSDLQFAVP